MRGYVKEFNSSILHIKNMFKEDRLFNLMFGLQGESKLNCKRQGVCDLPVAMTVANCLVDYKIVVPPPSIKTQVKGNKET